MGNSENGRTRISSRTLEKVLFRRFRDFSYFLVVSNELLTDSTALFASEKKLDRASGSCGPVCMIGAIGGSFFVLIAIVGSFVTSRYRYGLSVGSESDGGPMFAMG